MSPGTVDKLQSPETGKIARGSDGNLKITIGIISRGRPNYLAASIMSWLNLAKHPEDLQFIFALDDDDLVSITTYNEIAYVIRYYKATCSLITWKPVGYVNLLQRHNQMLPHYNGDLLLTISDDQFCHTHHWDVAVSNSVNEVYKKREDASVLVWMCGANNDKPHPDLCALNRNWLNIAGKYSITAGTDSYVRDMAKAIEKHTKNGQSIVRPTVNVYHLQRKFDLLPKDSGENFRKPPPYQGNESLWEDRYRDSKLLEDEVWIESTRHNDAIYRFHDGEVGKEYNSIVDKFKDYYGKK